MGILDTVLGKPTQDKFAKAIMSRIRDAGETRELVYDKEQFCIKADQHMAFLNNLFREYSELGRNERDAVIDNAVRGWFVDQQNLPEEFDDAKTDILPIVRCLSYFSNAKLHVHGLSDKEPQIAFHEIGEHLGVGLVYDLPTSMRSILPGDLDDWGVTFYEALEVASRNLRDIEMSQVAKIGDGTYAIATGDSYDASRMLILEDHPIFEVDGDYIAMPTNRDQLIVTGSNDVAGLTVMASLAKDMDWQNRPISCVPYRLADGAWQPWCPDESHPSFAEFKYLEAQFYATEYEEQKQLLQKVYEQEGVDVFVASLTVSQNDETKELISYCSWSQTVDSLLPVAKLVAFVEFSGDERNMLGTASWSDVVKSFGHLMEKQEGMFPIRYRVREFPDVELVKRLCKPV
jgi:uncharacterized protein YtpQ (UPF0354 family)